MRAYRRITAVGSQRDYRGGRAAPLPVVAPVAGEPVLPADPVAAPCVPPLMSLFGGVPCVPVPVPVPVGREPLPLDPLPEEEPLMPPGVAPDMPVPVCPLGLVDEPVDEPLPPILPELPDPLMLPPDMLPPDMLPPDMLPEPDEPLMLLPLPDVLPRWRRAERVRRRVERFFVPVLSCIMPVPLLAPAVLPDPVEPVPPVVVCADAASGRTAIVASVAMRFRMVPS